MGSRRCLAFAWTLAASPFLSLFVAVYAAPLSQVTAPQCPQPTVSSILPVAIRSTLTENQENRAEEFRSSWRMIGTQTPIMRPRAVVPYSYPGWFSDNDGITLARIVTSRQDRSPPPASSAAQSLSLAL
ncbi:MAG: hypothetical protein AB7G75_02560 [Candidatus Binatia bacterium]